LALRALGFKHYLYAAFAFAFTPVVFISSTYTIDYMLAMAFVIAAFYYITHSSRWGWVGASVFLGLAIGCRTTAAAMLLPFCFFLFQFSKERVARILLFTFVTILVGCITYIPVIKTYGVTFIATYFDTADRFPVPPLAKIIYKASIGVWGFIGMLVLVGCAAHVIRNRKQIMIENKERKILIACLITILLYMVIYIRVPHKSAFLVPMVPFFIMIYGLFLSSRAFKIYCVFITASSFFFSVNLTDALRGSKYSSLAFKFTTARHEIFIDPFTGPVFSDYTKRLNKIVYTDEVYHKTNGEQKKIILICGWWYNELQVRMWNCEKNNNIKFVFYINRQEIEKYISDGYEIYYLPEQNIYNDQYSHMTYTDSVAKLYM